MKTSTVLWGITPCSLVGRRQRFETYCVRVQGNAVSITWRKWYGCKDGEGSYTAVRV
jgi:hypothetical protein